MVNVKRSDKNPIIDIKDVPPTRDDFEVVGVFNAGAAVYGDEIILLLRVAQRAKDTGGSIYRCPMFDEEQGKITLLEFDRNDKSCNFSDTRNISKDGKNYTTSMSHLQIARSKDGENFKIDDKPFITGDNKYETLGTEDPRITKIGDKYYITYTAVSHCGISVMLCVTEDFKTCKKLGVIFPPDNKDVVLFPDKINGKYYALHRPMTGFGKPDIWLSESPDLMCWGNHRHIMGTRHKMWDSGRIGACCVPFLTDEGYLEIYHGATEDDRYCIGAALLDSEEPWKVLKRSKTPILAPEAEYEKNGFFGGVVFSCGCVVEGDNLSLYYGGADTRMCLAKMKVSEILNSLE